MNSSIKAQLRNYTLLLIVLPVIATLLAFYTMIRQEALREAQTDMLTELMHHRQMVERWLQYRLDDVVYASRINSVRNLDFDAMTRDFWAFRRSHPDFRSLVYVNAEGKTGIDFDSPPGLSVADREYFASAKQGRTHISPVLIGRTSGKAIVIFSAPIWDMREQFVGLVFGAVRINAIVNMVGSLHIAESDRAFIVNSADLTVLHAEGRGELANVSSVQSGDGSPRPYVNQRGVEVLGVSLPLKNGEWLLVQERSLDSILADMHKLIMMLILAAGASLLLLTPLLMRLSRRITSPLESISEMSEKIIEGQYTDTCPMLDTRTMAVEVRRLYDNFCRMAARLSDHVGELERLSTTDSLTGLGNRRRLSEEGERILSQCKRTGEPCACLMLDLDHFKAVNDTYGHSVGDEVLKAFASLIKRAARTSDLVLRLGGEEFCILAQASKAVDALALAERIREEAEALVHRHGEVEFRVTVSIGISELSGELRFGATSLDDMLAKADHALYQAKNAGRNRVVRWIWDGQEI